MMGLDSLRVRFRFGVNGLDIHPGIQTSTVG